MNKRNGYSYTLPIHPGLRADGYRICSGPALNGSHRLYWWSNPKNETIGDDVLSSETAEKAALAYIRSLPARRS